MILALCPYKCGTSFYINKKDSHNSDLVYHLNYYCFKYNISLEEYNNNLNYCFSNGIIEIVKENELKNHCEVCKKKESSNIFVSVKYIYDRTKL